MKVGGKVGVGVGVVSVCMLVSALLFSGVGSSDSVAVGFDGVSDEYRFGDWVNVSVVVYPNGNPVKAWELKVHFNEDVASCVGVFEGDLFDGYSTFFSDGVIDNVNGNVLDLYDLTLGAGNLVSDSGVAVVLCFRTVGYGTCVLELYDVGVTNSSSYYGNVSVGSASFFVFSPFDMDDDRVVGFGDVVLCGNSYGLVGSPGWIRADVNRDGRVSILDLVLVSVHFGVY